MGTSEDVIFLIKGRTGEGPTELERVPSQEYEDEALLQRLLDQHPEVLAGEQIEPEEPVRWFLVTREAGIPDAESGGNRWAVDHLLLDQHGRPTLVEDKRSSDGRLRREVVGQMLDYAANAQLYWPVDRIRSLAAERYGGTDALDEALAEFLPLDPGEDAASAIEDYWQQVDDKLRTGNVRLLFVADDLPRELRRVIEFLNAQMPGVEVLGIELRQYVTEDLRVLVPRLVGQTEYARREKSRVSRGTPLTQQEFLELMPEGEVRGFFEQLLASAQAQGIVPEFTPKGCSLRVRDPKEKLRTVAYLYPPGMQRNAEAEIWAFLEYLYKLGEDVESIRKRFTQTARFRESGSYTLRMSVTPENLGEARQVQDLLLRITDELKSRWGTGTS